MEQSGIHLISKKMAQKQYFNKAHNAKPLSQLDPNQEVLFQPQLLMFVHPQQHHQQSLNPTQLNIKAQGKRYCRTREHIHQIQQDIFTRNSTTKLEPQIPMPSYITKLSPPTRAQSQPIQRVTRSHITQPSNGCIPGCNTINPSSQTQHHYPAPLQQQLTASCHLTSLNDQSPPRHTGTPDAFPIYKHIEHQDKASPCARLTGTSKAYIPDNDDSKADTLFDKLYHHSHITPNPLNPKAMSQPGTLTILDPTPPASLHQRHNPNDHHLEPIQYQCTKPIRGHWLEPSQLQWPNHKYLWWWSSIPP